MKKTLIILMLFISIGAYSQNDTGVRAMVTLSGQDTVVIKRFDENQNLIFHKAYPQGYVSQILGWKYSDNKLQSYTWSHSNVGFIEYEYQYDSLNDIVNIYSYKLKGHPVPRNLTFYHSLNSLKETKEFKNYITNGERYLETRQYFKEGLLEKELKYGSMMEDTIQYFYTNDLLVRKKHTNKRNSYYHEFIYEYDSSGNETCWMKIFDSSDTTVMYQKEYKDGLLQEVIGIERGKLESRETYKYSNNKLKQKRYVDESGVELRKSGLIINIEEMAGLTMRIKLIFIEER